MRRRARLFAELSLFFGLPLLLALTASRSFLAGGPRASDFWTFWQAARDVLGGESPYPSLASMPEQAGRAFAPFVYPPAAAFLLAPLAVLPYGLAKVAFLLLNVVAVALALRLLRVRDWRCYGVAFGSAPIFAGAALGTISLLLLLGLAAAWRWRDRAVAAGLVVALLVAAKLFLWPLWFWLVRSGRYAAAAIAAVASVVAVTGSWAAIGFAGFHEYPELLRRLTELVGPNSYSTYALGRSLGITGPTAQAATYALGFLALAVAVRFVGDERRSVAALLGVAFVATPILWPHYLALLYVPVALARPRFGPLWLAPVAIWANAAAWSLGSPWRIGGSLALTFGILAAASVRRPGLYTAAPAGSRAATTLSAAARLGA